MEDDHKSEVASPLAPLEKCTLLISELVHSLPWFSLVQCDACTMNWSCAKWLVQVIAAYQYVCMDLQVLKLDLLERAAYFFLSDFSELIEAGFTLRHRTNGVNRKRE